ncbi:glycosyltransferase family 4 protein [Bacteroides uniformis]|uniref:glycosyltransferase family 4 protein n=1 Tax=Bacteroides uniformis TaxID=820 RepID=UPI00202E095E|nr:glycosyltransferase family 4 protein [Bacteroides uniformis]MCM1956746.1 glycosyltransferase family 4 protein [Bacteroides uniformis]
MSKILVVGYFGYCTNQLDGQTVKTRDVYRLVREQVKGEVDYYDTEDFQYHKIGIPKLFWKMIRCNILFYLPAQNNLKIIFPIIFCLSIVFRFKIHYFVVGGWLKEFLVKKPIHRFMLKRIEGIHVETKRLENELKLYFHFLNVDNFPNFRFFEFNPKRFRVSSRKKNLVICFLSRVEQSKGLDTLVEISEYLHHAGLSKMVKIDFYGQKKDDYFDTHLSENPMFEYKGTIQPSEVMSTLRLYDVLIFPSHYEGEGCPGILVEALSVGLPIIASNWKYNNEFIIDGVNGFLCDTFDAKSYLKAIKTMLFDEHLRKQMSKHAYRMSEYYSAKYAKRKLQEYVVNSNVDDKK